MNVFKFIKKHKNSLTALKGNFNNSYICVNATLEEPASLFDNNVNVFENIKIVGNVVSTNKFSLLQFINNENVVINQVFIDFKADVFVFSLIEQSNNVIIDKLFLKLEVNASQFAGISLKSNIMKIQLMLTEQKIKSKINSGLCYKCKML